MLVINGLFFDWFGLNIFIFVLYFIVSVFLSYPDDIKFSWKWYLIMATSANISWLEQHDIINLITIT